VTPSFFRLLNCIPDCESPRVFLARIVSAVSTLALLLTLSCTDVFAQAAASSDLPEPSGMQMLLSMVPMFVMVFLIFYLMVIKPQQLKLNAQKRLIDSLKKGDSVITSGGIHGKVFAVEGDHIVLEVYSNVRLKVEPEHIVKRQDKASADKEKSAA
jgi:preprotein translocase subunit YajC